MKVQLSSNVTARDIYDLMTGLDLKGKVSLKDDSISIKNLWINSVLKIKSDTIRIVNKGNILSKILAFAVFLLLVSKDALGFDTATLVAVGGFTGFMFVCSLISNMVRHSALSKRIKIAVKEKYR